MGLAGRFNPLRPKLWGECVAIIVGVYFSYDGSVGKRQGVRVEFCTTNHPNMLRMLTK